MRRVSVRLITHHQRCSRSCTCCCNSACEGHARVEMRALHDHTSAVVSTSTSLNRLASLHQELRFLLTSPAQLREWMTRTAEQFAGGFWDVIQSGGFCLGHDRVRGSASSAG